MSCLRTIFFGLLSLIIIKVTIASSEYDENDYALGYVDKNEVGDDIKNQDHDKGKGGDPNIEGKDESRDNDDGGHRRCGLTVSAAATSCIF